MVVPSLRATITGLDLLRLSHDLRINSAEYWVIVTNAAYQSGQAPVCIAQTD